MRPAVPPLLRAEEGPPAKAERSPRIRRAGPDDLDALTRFHTDLPPVTAQQPFPVASRPGHGPAPTAVGTTPARFIAVRGTAVVAEGGWQEVGDGDADLDLVVHPGEPDALAGALLDALIDSGRAAGIRNLRTAVAVNNGPMFALLHGRPYVALGHDDHTVAHLSIAVAAETPEWAPGQRRPRVLIEGGGLGWVPLGTIRSLDIEVLLCPGPRSPAGPACPVLEGRPCPLVEGADAVVCAVAAEDPRDRLVTDHRVRGPERRLFVTADVPADAAVAERLPDDRPPLEAVTRALRGDADA